MEFVELPEFVYKYVTWEKDYHRRIISDYEIFFSSVRNFNDPFDSMVPFRYDFCNEKQILNMYCEAITHDYPHLSESEVQIKARNELLINDIRDSERIQYNIDTQREYLATKFGIFSASNRNDSILMWSHYSNMHKGICVRFNCKKFHEFIETECIMKNLMVYYHNVEYYKEYPILKPSEYDDDEAFLISLLIKYDDWKYENEIRFILFDKPNTAISLYDGIIDQIILGCRISKDNRDNIINIAKAKNIEVLQAYINNNSFCLGFQKINI
jgi:hypothetical protein